MSIYLHFRGFVLDCFNFRLTLFLNHRNVVTAGTVAREKHGRDADERATAELDLCVCGGDPSACYLVSARTSKTGS